MFEVSPLELFCFCVDISSLLPGGTIDPRVLDPSSSTSPSYFSCEHENEDDPGEETEIVVPVKKKREPRTEVTVQLKPPKKLPPKKSSPRKSPAKSVSLICWSSQGLKEVNDSPGWQKKAATPTSTGGRKVKVVSLVLPLPSRDYS